MNSAICKVVHAVRIFLSLSTSTVTLMRVFVLLFTKPFKCKGFFQNSFSLDGYLKLAAFILETHNSSGRTWANFYSASA